jgi:hypothetical protein
MLLALEGFNISTEERKGAKIRKGAKPGKDGDLILLCVLRVPWRLAFVLSSQS